MFRAYLLSLTVALAPSAFSADEVNVTSGLTLKGAGLAAHGYDVVAYFTDSRPVLGNPKFSAIHEGATYRFASTKSQKAFEADPARYTPQYGGFCAFGVSVGAKFDGNPNNWKIVGGKLYLNLNDEIQQKWLADVVGNIANADSSWPGIRNKAAAQLKP